MATKGERYSVFGHHIDDGWVSAVRGCADPQAAKEYGRSEFSVEDGYTAFRVIDTKEECRPKQYSLVNGPAEKAVA